MSAVDFALEGTSGEAFEEMDFSQKDPEEVSLIENGPSYIDSSHQVSKALSDRIIEMNYEDKTLYIIDNAVKVLDLSKQVRQDKVAFWQSRRLEMYGISAVGCAGAIGAVGLMIYGAPALGIATLVGSIFVAVMGLWRAGQASDQINHWQTDIPSDIAVQRKDVFDRGFLVTLLQGNPKPYSAVLNPAERQGLYHVYFDQFVKKLTEVVTNQNKVRLIEESIAKGPLSPEVLKAAQLTDYQLYYLEGYLQEYSRVVTDIQWITGAAKEQQNNMKREIEGRIAQIEKEKSNALLPAKQLYDLQKERLDRQRIQALRNHPEGADIVEYRRFVEQDYKDALREVEITYNHTKNIISGPFDERIKREREVLDLYYKNINNYKADQLLPYFLPIASIQRDALIQINSI